MKKSQLKQLIRETLNEIRIHKPGQRILPTEYKAALETLTYRFGEDTSGFNLYKPQSEGYTENIIINQYNGDERHEMLKAFEKLLEIPGQYVSDDLFDMGYPPGAPSNAYYIRITIDKDNIVVESPYIAYDELIYVGWFDSNRKYHPDKENFDENGYYIGNVD